MLLALATSGGCFAEPVQIQTETEAETDNETSAETASSASMGEGTGGPTSPEGGPTSESATPADNDTSIDGSTGSPPQPTEDVGSSGDATDDSSTGSSVIDECDGFSRAAFINFDGVTITYGDESASDNESDRSEMAGEWSPYTHADRDEVLARVRDVFAPFDLCVTDERPTTLPYDMVVVTDTNREYNVTLPYGDCQDAREAGSVVRFSANPSPPMSTTAQKGNTVAVLLGISYGLTTVQEPNDVMFAGLASAKSATFTDACLEYAGAVNPCGRSHGCPSYYQNAFAMVLDVLGPR